VTEKTKTPWNANSPVNGYSSKVHHGADTSHDTNHRYGVTQPKISDEKSRSIHCTWS